jgi:hypothetical protein
MTTQRQQSLARAIERCSARDLRDFIEDIGLRLGEQTKYVLLERVLRFAKEHYDMQQETEE